ncbi:acid protease [Sistotremastrum niveocremeum HHB9708]|uniref:Acid protease n=1 Tax=Sistotremastrum niveocremeum HHB9708 TaxID=1314777 RepID=A0A164TUX5_9AGAM|nr:acid protease [Sistotremastrum niveocremeum HHB9708]
MVKIPIRTLHASHYDKRSPIPPVIRHQQHANRAQRRYAAMTGGTPPSDEELTANLKRAIDHFRLGLAAAGVNHDKRYVVLPRRADQQGESGSIDDLSPSLHFRLGLAAAGRQPGSDITRRDVGSDSSGPSSGDNQSFSPDGNTQGTSSSSDSSQGVSSSSTNQGVGSVNSQNIGSTSTNQGISSTDSQGVSSSSNSQGISSTDSQRVSSSGSSQGSGSDDSENVGQTPVHHPKSHKKSKSEKTRRAPKKDQKGVKADVVGSTTDTVDATSTVSDTADTVANTGVSSVVIEAEEDSTLTEANPPSDSNTIGLDIDSNDLGYVGQIQIGTPPRNFLLLMDSGSADLWVGSENCQSSAGGGCGNHTFLGSTSSSSFQQGDTTFAVYYGSGNVSGTTCVDNLSIAGLPLVQHQFGTADTESASFASNNVPFDGIMGLGQGILSKQGVPTPVESLKTNGEIPARITSFKIPRLADGLNDGEVTFGALDPSKFDAQTLTPVPNINKNGFWEAPMSVLVNGQPVITGARSSILDTGTTVICAPPDDVDAIHAAIAGAQKQPNGSFTVPCTLNDTVTLTFKGQPFDIDPRDIASFPVNVLDPAGECMSGIVPANGSTSSTQWLTGDVFLKNAYFSVDEDKNTISLAKLT